ncbi:hypothetical protein [Anaerocolumna xylanovorans]|uniref:Uncharacterized protein n=1 Tax=Anaerocolumna xylanovorans DSM 12503 TaxID=1121345 RepID=A0A1M7XX20_9FIRM|nr:hypothetical protein [Anaerocolumna xylanovorans]SHO43170.1 hypothetical protein SAMN02745217_00116 [Anaerocolumna xylanovorans DSM 12503]
MKEIKGADVNGYITGGLDLTVRARTVNDEIIALTVTPDGTNAMFSGVEITLPDEIRHIDRIVDLLDILKNCRVELLDGKALQLLPLERQVGLRAAGGCNSQGCATAACTTNYPNCNAEACAGAACSPDVSPCFAEACAANACAALASPCNGLLCSAKLCAADAAPCATVGCVAAACAAASAPCAAAGCAGKACAVDVIPCVGDGQLGPCLVNFPYCPFIL